MPPLPQQRSRTRKPVPSPICASIVRASLRKRSAWIFNRVNSSAEVLMGYLAAAISCIFRLLDGAGAERGPFRVLASHGLKFTTRHEQEAMERRRRIGLPHAQRLKYVRQTPMNGHTAPWIATTGKWHKI